VSTINDKDSIINRVNNVHFYFIASITIEKLVYLTTSCIVPILTPQYDSRTFILVISYVAETLASAELI
jgi:hypothetical protein